MRGERGLAEHLVTAGRGADERLHKVLTVVLAEAGMLSAQLAGPNSALFGMNRPGIDNRQLAQHHALALAEDMRTVSIRAFRSSVSAKRRT